MKLAEGLFTVRRKAGHREALLVPRYAYVPLEKYVLPGETQPPRPPVSVKRPRRSPASGKTLKTIDPIGVG